MNIAFSMQLSLVAFLAFGAAQGYEDSRVSFSDMAMDEKGYIYLLYAEYGSEDMQWLVKLKPDGTVDASFADKGFYKFEEWGDVFNGGEIEVRLGLVAVSNLAGSISILDTSGIPKKEFRWQDGYLSSAHINDDGSVVGSMGMSRFYKLTPSLEYDAQFGVQGMQVFKGKKYYSSDLVPRSDGTYVISGLASYGGFIHNSFGCMEASGAVCSDQEDYYVRGRYDSQDDRFHGLMSGAPDQIVVVGRSLDNYRVKLLFLKENLQVSHQEVLNLLDPSDRLTWVYEPKDMNFYMMMGHYESNHMSIYKLDTHGRLDKSYGTGGVARLDLSLLSDLWPGELVVANDGKVTVGGDCGPADSWDSSLCLVRLGVDGFLDKTFGVDGVAIFDGI